MSSDWPALEYDRWSATCDTLHAHTQVLGKLAAKMAAPEPQLQHAALRLTARGWETIPLPAGDGALVIALDLRTHEAVVEHTSGTAARVPLGPDRAVGPVTRAVVAAVRGLAGDVEFDPRPQEVVWTAPLDADEEHATYDPEHVAEYFAAATRVARVLSAFRAPYRGRCTPVNAWWGSFDLSVSLFSGAEAEPPSDRLHHAQRDGRPGGRGRLVAGRPALPQAGVLRLRPPGLPAASTHRSLTHRRRASTSGSASSCSTGPMSSPPRIPTRPRWDSPGRPSVTRASPPNGTPR